MLKRIVLIVVGLLAGIAIATSAWNLGAGEDLFWGLPWWIGLVIIAFAAWWFFKTIGDLIRSSDVDVPVGETEKQGSTLLSGIPVFVAVLLFVLGWVFGR